MPFVHDPSVLQSDRLRQAYAYWDGKRRGRPMPSRRDIDPVEIPSLLSRLMLVDVLRDPLDFRFRLLGTEIVARSHRNYTGLRLSELPGKGPGSVVWNNCEQVVLYRAPFSRTPPYVGPDRYTTTVENLMLPLSEDGETVTMIFQVLEFGRARARQASFEAEDAEEATRPQTSPGRWEAGALVSDLAPALAVFR